MADVDGVVKVEMPGDRGQVVGVVVHVVTIGSLGGAAVSTPVGSNDPVAMVEEEQHLGVPVVSRKGPAVAEHDGLPRPPVLVEDLDAIGTGDRAHARFSCLEVMRKTAVAVWICWNCLSAHAGRTKDCQVWDIDARGPRAICGSAPDGTLTEGLTVEHSPCVPCRTRHLLLTTQSHVPKMVGDERS
jgi:hypothetical protein